MVGSEMEVGEPQMRIVERRRKKWYFIDVMMTFEYWFKEIYTYCSNGIIYE